VQPQVVYVEAPKKKRGIFKKLLLGFGALMALIVIIAVVAGSPEADTDVVGTSATSESESSASSSSSSSSSAADADPSRVAITYTQIINDIEGMTDAQFDKYADAAKNNNRADRWTATVLEVDDQVLGSEYFAHLTINPGDPFDDEEISIDIAEDVALGLNLGDEIVFSGDVKDFTNFLNLPTVYLNNVTIHSQQAG